MADFLFILRVFIFLELNFLYEQSFDLKIQQVGNIYIIVRCEEVCYSKLKH